MAIFASDTESGTAGTLLENHPLGVGGSWVKGGGRTGSMALTANATSRLSAGEGAYFATGTPAGGAADYDVEEDFYFATANNYRALIFRGNVSGALGYMVGIDNGGSWVIYKDTTAQASVAATITAGSTHHVKGSIRGNVITMSVDGTQILTWTDNANAYPGAGQAGIYGYGVGTDSYGVQGKNFVATDLSTSSGSTTFTLAQIQALGGAGASPLYGLTKTTGGSTYLYGQSDGIEIQITGTRAVFAVQAPTSWAVSIDGNTYTQGADDGAGKLLAFTGLSDGPHLVKIKTASTTSGIAATATLVVTGAGPTIATPPNYGPWRTIGSYQYPTPATYVTSGGFDAADPWIAGAAASTFAFVNNDKFSQPSVKFGAQASSVWLWCQSGDVPRCVVDGFPLRAVPYVAPLSTAGFVPAGWVKVADLDEPAGTGTTGITAACAHTFEITLGNYTTTQNGSPIYRVMLGGVGAAFLSTPPASDYAISMGDSITQGQSYGGANYDGTAGSYAYHASLKLATMPYLNGLAGTKIADLDTRFAGSVAPVGAALGRSPRFGVIYMGSNDNNVAGDTAFIASYQSVITKWVAAYPGVPLFCLGLKRDVSGTYAAQPVSQNIATAVTNYQTANPTPGAKIHFIDMSPPTNIDGELHPSNLGARIMGDYVAAQVKGVLSPSSSAVATTYSLILPATSTVGETQSIVILFDAPLTTATTVTLVDASATLGNGGSVTVAIGSAYGIITRAAGSAGSHTLSVSHAGQSGIADPTAGLAITDIAASVSGSVDFAAMAAYFAAHPIAADVEQILKSPQAAQALHDEELATPQALGSDGRLLLSVGTGSGQINLSGGNLAGPVAVASNSIAGISNAVIQNLPSGSGGGISPQAMTDLLASGVVKIAHDGLDNVMVEPGVNMRQSQTIVFAASAGAVAGAGTGVIVIKGGNSPTTRITSVADNRGNRNVVTLALPQ